MAHRAGYISQRHYDSKKIAEKIIKLRVPEKLVDTNSEFD